MSTAAQPKQSADALSVLGKRWQLRSADNRGGMLLAQRMGVPEVVGTIMANRGVELTDAAAFLEPNLRDLPDPNHLLDMDKAVERLLGAVTQKQKIAIFGDYDVDGSCGAAMLLRYFRALGMDPLLYVPDRLTEGYGPNAVAMERLKAQGADLVVTVDCGCVAYDAMDAAAKLGLDVVITDHHQGAIKKPVCVALVNPNRVDEESPHTNLSGTGVAFLVLVGLNRALREKGFFTAEQPEPDLRLLLDLVAVATVCDVVPLGGVNRILVDRGLKVMATRRNPGLTALADVAGVDSKPGTYHAGFLIGPRINAGGRIAACDLGATLLSTMDGAHAHALAQRLHQLNQERKEIEEMVQADAMQQAEAMFTPEVGALVLAGKNWHPGVIGIVASRVKDKFHRPVFVLSLDGDVAKGSGRSISGIDLGRCVQALGDILVGGGGHKMAAGLSILPENIPAFREKLNQMVLQQAARAEGDVFTPYIKLDGFLTPRGANLDLLDQIERLEPYGMGNPEPRFALTGVRVDAPRVVGEKHLSLSLTDGAGGRIRGIAFRAMENPLGSFLLNTAGKAVSVCGSLRRNVWNGSESAQFQLDDAFDGIWQG
ncbi:MAG: single-stranded-DNA-specific exonuclease RecJ [Proteobacteria bacterium]|nr:single-stranded-DNA-specific exonuclease RecJ [Pseudomonadota bacterium]